jgi:hypothetical protein
MVLTQHFSAQDTTRLVNGAADPNKSISSGWCSICGPAKENQMKKNQNILVWLSKMVLAQHFSIQDTEAGKWAIRPSPEVVLSMWPGKRKSDEEKSKHTGLAQQNGFSPVFCSTQ